MLQALKDHLLLFAVNWRVQSLAAWCIAHGADVNTRDQLRNTPLLLAVRNLDKNVVQLLLSATADPNLKDSLNLPALTWAFVSGAQKGIDHANHDIALRIMETLIQSGAKVNDPASPLGSAVRLNDMRAVALLTKHGADWHMRLEGDGRSATQVLGEEGSDTMRQRFSSLT